MILYHFHRIITKKCQDKIRRSDFFIDYVILEGCYVHIDFNTVSLFGANMKQHLHSELMPMTVTTRKLIVDSKRVQSQDYLDTQMP